MSIPVRVPLRHYRWAREPYLEVLDNAVSLVLPVCFGRHPLQLPVAELAVFSSGFEQDEGWAFDPPLRVPYAATTSELASPNLTLLFRNPRRLPPLRFGGAVELRLPYRQSRRPGGVLVDGISVRAEHPDEAIAALGQAGVEIAELPNSWLRQTRRERSVLPRAAVRRRRWADKVRTAGLLGLVMTVPDLVHPSVAGLIVLAIGVPLLLVLPSLVTRASARSSQPEPAENEQLPD